MAATKKETNHWLILIILALAQFMVVLDVSIVNVMLPTVQHDFHLTETSLQWIITAYTVTFGGFLLLGGRAADLFGRRKVFLAGVAAFALISLVDGLSQTGSMLIIMRGLQGLAGAIMSPAALSIVLVTYKEGHARNVALSVWGAVASGGAAVGVLLGGIITQYLGWRWNFFINVPIGIFVLIMASRLVPLHESEEKKTSIDLSGALSVTAALVLLVYGFSKAPSYGWSAASTLSIFAASAVLFVVFIYNELKVKHPLVPLKIFKIRNVAAGDIIQVCLAAGLYATFFFSTLYLQEILNYSPVKTGFAFLPVPFAIALTASNAPRVIRRIGYKLVLILAPLLTAGGLFWLAHVPLSGNYFTHLLPAMVIMGFGLGFTFVSVLVAATSGIPGHLSGLASGLINTSQQVGGSVGLAILTGIAASVTTRYLTNLHHRPSAIDIAKAGVHADHIGFYIASTFSLFAVLLAIFVIKQVKSKAKPGDNIAASMAA
ncbi:MAG: MFS transporter [Candidatus Saccharimonadales bacterium]